MPTVDAGRRREHGLVADRQPAQPRAHRADVASARSAASSRRSASGRATRASPTAAASSTSSGCSSTWRGCAPSWEALRLLNWRQAWCMTNGGVNFADASTVKVYASEFYVEAYRALLEVLGQRGVLKRDSPAAAAQRPARDALPRRADPHLRRRHQRGAARHHRHGRAADAAVDPLSRYVRHRACTVRVRTREIPMDFAFTEDQEALRQLARTDLRRPLHARALKRDRGDAGVVRPRAVGRAGQGQPARRRAAGGRRRRRARASSSSCVLLEESRPRRGAGAGVADAGARRAADRPVRLRGAAPALAARRRTRRDDPHRGAGRERLDDPAHHHRHGAARRRHLAARRRQDLRAGRAPRRAHPGAGAHRRRRGRRLPASIRTAAGVQLRARQIDHQRRAAVRAAR